MGPVWGEVILELFLCPEVMSLSVPFRSRDQRHLADGTVDGW